MRAVHLLERASDCRRDHPLTGCRANPDECPHKPKTPLPGEETKPTKARGRAHLGAHLCTSFNAAFQSDVAMR